jgi:hypothetical protein
MTAWPVFLKDGQGCGGKPMRLRARWMEPLRMAQRIGCAATIPNAAAVRAVAVRAGHAQHLLRPGRQQVHATAHHQARPRLCYRVGSRRIQDQLQGRAGAIVAAQLRPHALDVTGDGRP